MDLFGGKILIALKIEALRRPAKQRECTRAHFLTFACVNPVNALRAEHFNAHRLIGSVGT